MLTPGKVREMFIPIGSPTIPRSPTPRAGVPGSGWTKASGGRSVARRRASASQRVLAHADVPRYPDADLRASQPYARGRALEEGTDLLNHVGLDSIQAMEVLLAAEGRFDMSIP